MVKVSDSVSEAGVKSRYYSQKISKPKGHDNWTCLIKHGPKNALFLVPTLYENDILVIIKVLDLPRS